MVRSVDEFPVREEDLQAYVDGLLDIDRRAAIEAYLARRPQEAERAAAYRAQNLLLHQAFDAVVDEPLSAPLDELKARLAHVTCRRRAVWQKARWAAAAACVAIVTAASWMGYERFFAPTTTKDEPPLAFTRLAIDAHGLLTGDASPPLAERGAESGNALVGWLSQRATQTAKPAPDLKQFSLELSGGRVFLLGERPVVQLVYRDKQQQKLSLYLGANPDGDDQNAFTFVQQGELSTFYWRQRNLEFSLVGRMNRDELLAIAKAVHDQLNMATSGQEGAPAPRKTGSFGNRIPHMAGETIITPGMPAEKKSGVTKTFMPPAQ
jgi:anti-sigma factor RsiW